MGDRPWFILYVLICLEVGIFLVVVPWLAIWERNYFLQAFPALRGVLLEPVVRGAVSGLGVANMYLALNEVIRRRAARSSRTELFPGGFRLRDDRDERATLASKSAPRRADSRAWARDER